MSQAFDAYSAYYDLLYRDKDYSGEVERVDHLLKEYGRGVKSVLEFGAGTGIHGALLVKKGYQMTGIELSASMVERAKKTSTFEIHQGDIRNKKIPQKYDSVISLFHVMSYLRTNDDMIQCLKNAHEHLREGGIFVFDFWYTPAVYEQKPVVRVKRIENEQIRVIRTAEPKIDFKNNTVDVHYTVFTQQKSETAWQKLEETHVMRHFSLSEIELFSAAVGFEILHASEFPTGKKPAADTWGVGVVLRKKS